MPSEAEAVESLMELGLTEYEARAFVALTQLSEGTAKEISRVADIPQSRVYDVADQLFERGLIDIQQSNPRKYYALPVPTAIKRIQREYSGLLDIASENLAALESRHTDENGVWEIANQQDIINRAIMFIQHAEDEIYYHVRDEELLDEEILAHFSAASERGVSILIETPSESARERVYEALSDARVAISDLDFDPFPEEGRGPGRLLMIDRETVLMSALDEGLVPPETDETGLWGSEVGRGLVVWLRRLLAARIENVTFVEKSD